ncbi:MAG: hypothetical protein A4E28_00250 [Methanocella sp. PtaU1.Bin125]|nr:MAG: hypothetical protein A4E28_00250 [Methanocella sp. PtaU1.Bin125]
MVKKPKKKRESGGPAGSPGKRVPDDVIEAHVYEILRRLSAEDPAIAKRVGEIALDLLADVDPEQIAKSIFYDLNSLDVEELYCSSGRTRDGYVDPGERARDMFEEAVEPYIEKLKNYLELSMDDEAKAVCMGILKGLYKVGEKSINEVVDYAADAPSNSFSEVLDMWKEGNTDPEKLREMDQFVKNNFPEWYREK